jgi:hypothetical protein
MNSILSLVKIKYKYWLIYKILIDQRITKHYIVATTRIIIKSRRLNWKIIKRIKTTDWDKWRFKKLNHKL